MKSIGYTKLLFLSMCLPAMAPAISIVYNFRIAQSTRQSVSGQASKKYGALALLFDQYQKKYNGSHQNFAGALGSFLYTFDPYYFRIDFAAAHIDDRPTVARPTFSGAATDDILFTMGRKFNVTDRARLTASGFLGIPTHSLDTLQHVDFGTGQVGTGLQLDGSYAFNQRNAVVYGARYIHFFARQAQDFLGRDFTFTIGNIADALLAYRYGRTKQGFEVGYTILSLFGADISPTIADIVTQTNYRRSNFYFIYKRKIPLKNTLSGFLASLSYGFDHNPKEFSNKHIITLWGAWGVVF